MSRESKILEEIRLKEQEINRLKDSIEILRLQDWKEKEGKYWLVETFPVNGKTNFYIYHIIEVKINRFILEYVCLTNKYITRNEYNFVIEPCYMKWTEVTKKEFDKECLKVEKKNDFRIDKTAVTKDE